MPRISKEEKAAKAKVARPRRRALPTPEEMLSRTVGAKLNAVRKGRGITAREFAKKIGISYGFARKLLAGRVLPGPEVQARCLAWATQNISWEQSPGLKHRWARKGDSDIPKGWKKIVVWLPYPTRVALHKVTTAHGYSVTMWMMLALERMLADEIFIQSSKASLDAIARARVTTLINDYPMVREVMQIDVALAVELGVKFPERSAVEAKVGEHPVPNEAIKQLVMKDGIAEPIADPDQLWRERLEEI